MAGAIARRAPTPPASSFACVENKKHAEEKNVHQEKSEGQPQSNPASRTHENGTQQATAEAVASSGSPAGAQPLSNPASRAPENGTEPPGAEVVADSSAGATAQPQINSISRETSVPESQRIPVDRIDPFPYQFRQTFDEEKMRELSESMQQVGLKQPIFVRPIGDRFEVISGERRLRAAKLLGWTSISAVVQNLSNLDAAIGGLVENVQREDLTPIERARAFQQLTEPPFELSQREIAKRTGLDHSVILRTVELLKQPQQIQELLSRATISPTHVRALRGVKRDSDRAKLAEQAAAEHWSVKETEKRAREARRSEKSQPQESREESGKGDLPAWDWLHRVLEILRAITLLRRLGKWLLAFAIRLIPSGDRPSRGGFLPARDIAEPPKEDAAAEHPTSPGAKAGT
jgi:ParB family chromosome partitioning protein